MNKSLILQLQTLLPHGNYKGPDLESEPDSNGIVSSELYFHDTDYFFIEGFKLGLKLGLECAE